MKIVALNYIHGSTAAAQRERLEGGKRLQRLLLRRHVEVGVATQAGVTLDVSTAVLE